MWLYFFTLCICFVITITVRDFKLHVAAVPEVFMMHVAKRRRKDNFQKDNKLNQLNIYGL